MGRFNNDEAETDEDDQTFDGDNRGFVKRKSDQPRRSPIRRKTEFRQEEGMKLKGAPT